jgi:hypothetical protein
MPLVFMSVTPVPPFRLQDGQDDTEPVAVTIEADGVGRYSQDTEAALYFCILEALRAARASAA